MAVLDKLKFWKKKDPILDYTQDPFGNTPSNLGLSGGTGHDFVGKGMDSTFPQTHQEPDDEFPTFGMRPPSHEPEPTQFTPMQQPASPNQASQSSNSGHMETHLQKDMEIISSKLDTVKVMLEHLSQRLEKIERMAEDQQESSSPRRRGRW